MPAFFDTLAWLLEVLLKGYQWLIVIAVLLTWISPDPRHPVVRVLHRVTQPAIRLATRLLPQRWSLLAPLAALAVLWVLEIALPASVRIVEGALNGGLSAAEALLGWGVVLCFALLTVTRSVLLFLALVLLVWFVITLVRPSPHNMLVRMIGMVVDPLISPFQRRLPRMSLDFSPLLALLACMLLQWILTQTLVQVFIPRLPLGL